MDLPARVVFASERVGCRDLAGRGEAARALGAGRALGAHALCLHELLVVNVDRHPFPILWSIIGAAVFVALAHLISRGPTHQWRHD